MKVRRRDGSDARAVLAGMVLDRTVCSRIAGQWPKHGGLFDAPWANLVGGWCVEHLRKYGEPPNGQLRRLYEEWASTTETNEETIKGVEQFLQLVDREHEQASPVNSNFLLDQADRYFNSVRLKEGLSHAEDLLQLGRVKDAEEAVASIRRIELASTRMIKAYDDSEAFRKAWESLERKALIQYPGAMHDFLGRWLQRDSLIGFMAPDKTGKSVFLLDLTVRAVRNRCRVAYFDVGDNTQEQVMRRLGSRVARHPMPDNFRRDVYVPISVDEDGEVECRLSKFDRPLGWRAAFGAIKKICRGVDRLRVMCHPNGTASVATISAELSDWEREEGWVPDVVVIDYADILAPPPGVRETLDQIDETWKQLRRLSQERHCLVVTATQASAAAYGDKAKVLRKQHFSGRKTKLAHVNGMVGINVSDSDRQAGITRLNWIVRREGKYTENEQMIVAGCWAWYDPVVRVARRRSSSQEMDA